MPSLRSRWSIRIIDNHCLVRKDLQCLSIAGAATSCNKLPQLCGSSKNWRSSATSNHFTCCTGTKCKYWRCAAVTAAYLKHTPKKVYNEILTLNSWHTRDSGYSSAFSLTRVNQICNFVSFYLTNPYALWACVYIHIQIYLYISINIFIFIFIYLCGWNYQN